MKEKHILAWIETNVPKKYKCIVGDFVNEHYVRYIVMALNKKQECQLMIELDYKDGIITPMRQYLRKDIKRMDDLLLEYSQYT